MGGATVVAGFGVAVVAEIVVAVVAVLVIVDVVVVGVAVDVIGAVVSIVGEGGGVAGVVVVVGLDDVVVVVDVVDGCGSGVMIVVGGVICCPKVCAYVCLLWSCWFQLVGAWFIFSGSLCCCFLLFHFILCSLCLLS